jgi:peptidoglycan/LPS O-acetylase OafA/YrhL
MLLQQTNLNAVIWTMLVELVASVLMVPFLMVSRSGRWMGPALLIGLMGLGWLRSTGGTDVSRFLFCFQLGFLIAVGRERIPASLPSASLACLAVGLFAGARPGGLSGFGNTIVLAAGAGLLMVAVLSLARAPVAHWLDHRVSRFAGQVPYSVYLLHIPVIFVMVQLFARAGFAAWPAGVLVPAFFLSTLITTLVIAALRYRWVEAPSVRLGRAFSERNLRCGSA